MLVRAFLILATVLAVAGCATSRQDSYSGTAATRAPVQPISGTFSPALPNTIRVTVLDPEPAEQIQLVGPGGIWAAPTLERDRIVTQSGPVRRYYRPYYDDYFYDGYWPGRFGYGPGHRHWFGPGFGYPTPVYDYVREVPTTRHIRSVGTVPILNPAAYRAAWAQFRLRVVFPNGRISEVPAPRPPAP